MYGGVIHGVSLFCGLVMSTRLHGLFLMITSLLYSENKRYKRIHVSSISRALNCVKLDAYILNDNY